MNLNLNLNQREKLAVGGGIVFLAVFFLLQWIVFPVFEKEISTHCYMLTLFSYCYQIKRWHNIKN